MTTKTIVLGLAAAGLIAAPAMAQDAEPYVNIGVEALDFEGASGNIVGRIGTTFTDYLGVEGEARVGVLEDNDDFKIDYGFAGYGVVRFPASPQFDVFGRLGYHYTDSELGDADGIAFGAGGQYNFGPGLMSGIRAEYTNLDGDGGSGDVYSIAYVRKF